VNKTRFSLEELQALANKADVAAAEAPEAPLSDAFRRLKEAADGAGAALFRFAVMTNELAAAEATEAALAEERAAASSSPSEAPPSGEGYEEPEGSEEAPDGSQEPAEDEPEPPPVFMVRPRSGRRRCSVCNEPQWKSESGWVCKNGHGGA